MSLDHVRVLRAELSRLIEPGDLLAGVVIQHLGPVEAHQLITSPAAPGAALITAVSEQAELAGLGPRQRRLTEGLRRWRTRLGQIHGRRELDTIRRLGGGLVAPEDRQWPTALHDLGPAAPLCLWYRSGGSSPLDAWTGLPHAARRIAVVGSREVTDYGVRVTSEMVEDLVRHGVCVVSGGAYGVDAAAHRAALRRAESASVGTVPTIAVLAGGLDRLYPAGNEQLLRGVAQEGLLVSELPPGASPTRHRFLQRNRLIAGLTAATVIVEARWRSGAQSTAHHALSLDRPVGVVPGSIHSASSAGCHRLLRETPAQVVTDAAEVVELLSGSSPGDTRSDGSARGQGVESQPKLSGSVTSLASGTIDTPETHHVRAQDSLREADLLLFDALPLRRLSSPGKLSEVAGLPVPQVLAGLTRLHRGGLAREVGGVWGREV